MGELTELETELQHTDAITPLTRTSPNLIPKPTTTPPPHNHNRTSNSDQDNRSSIDSAPTLFSPGMMSDFSFGRRTSATTSTSSSFSSIPPEDDTLLDIESTPKIHRDRVDTSSPISPREATPIDILPSLSLSRHVRNSSIVSSISAVSSYYTARSRASTPDPDSPWSTTRPNFPSLFVSRSSPFAISSSSSPSYSPRRITNHPRSPFDRGGGGGGGTGLFNSAGNQEYRAPLGIEAMRAAYRASARRHAASGGSEADENGDGFTEREYMYRRRSAGNVGPSIRPMAVR